MSRRQNYSSTNLSSTADAIAVHGCEELRGKLLVELPFSVTVRGVNQAGQRFTLETVLDTLSPNGLYLRLMRPVRPGTTLFVVVRFTVARAHKQAAPGVAARGVVVRAEPRPGGAWGIAMMFTRHRFLYARPESTAGA